MDDVGLTLSRDEIIPVNASYAPSTTTLKIFLIHLLFTHKELIEYRDIEKPLQAKSVIMESSVLRRYNFGVRWSACIGYKNIYFVQSVKNRLFLEMYRMSWIISHLVYRFAKSAKILKCLLQSTALMHIALAFMLIINSVEAFCPHGCFCNDVSVDCKEAGLEIVPILLNPRVVSLSFANNRITSLQGALVFYTDLTSLDLSGNQISSLGPNNFEEQKLLRSLNLDNNTITLLEENNFVGLSMLRYLSLNNNYLGIISNRVFKGLDTLETLQLANNRIRNIDSDGFAFLPGIRTVNLMTNKLQRVPVASLQKLSSLTELILCDNEIQTVPDRAFESLINLTHLNLSKNKINTLYPEAFLGLQELRVLHLQDNRLSAVPISSFSALEGLTDLDLSGNMFVTLPADMLRDLSSLKTLKLERCPHLTSMHRETFVSGWQLQVLSLTGNMRLTSLPPAALAPLLVLRVLDLSSCGLTTLQPTQIPMRQLTSLDISGNPLHCNCSLMWLVTIASNNSLSPGSPTCAAPPSLHGVPLNDLGSGTCGPVVGPRTIAACAAVAIVGLIFLILFVVVRWRRNKTSIQSNMKVLQFCPETTSLDPRSPVGHGSTLSGDIANMQVYTSSNYYQASAPPINFTYPHQRQPLHMCPSDCPCIRKSPALLPLLRTPSSTPMSQPRLPGSKSPSLTNQSVHYVEFPPPPPNRPPPSVSSHLQEHLAMHNVKHIYPYSTYNINIGRPVRQGSTGDCITSPAQLMPSEWLYATTPGSSDDPQQHWYASIDRSSSSGGAGNESSGYWEEEKELATTSLLPPDHRPPLSAPTPDIVAKTDCADRRKDDGPLVIGCTITPTSYI